MLEEQIGDGEVVEAGDNAASHLSYLMGSGSSLQLLVAWKLEATRAETMAQLNTLRWL